MIDVTPEYLLSQGLSESLPKRFWAKVEKTETCWLWTAYANEDGYGRIWAGHRGNSFIPAHVVSWILHFGPVPRFDPKGIHVLHSCDNPPCVKPSHLFLGTALDNACDRDKKGRRIAGEGEQSPQHKLTEKEVFEIRSMYGPGYSCVTLGLRFGVDQSTIYSIIKRKTWRHI